VAFVVPVLRVLLVPVLYRLGFGRQVRIAQSIGRWVSIALFVAVWAFILLSWIR
jgi:hypothetical protein